MFCNSMFLKILTGKFKNFDAVVRYQCQFWAAFQSKKCRGVATNFGCFFVDCDQFWPRFLNMCLILGLGCEPHLVVPLARFLGTPLGKKLIFF